MLGGISVPLAEHIVAVTADFLIGKRQLLATKLKLHFIEVVLHWFLGLILR